MSPEEVAAEVAAQTAEPVNPPAPPRRAGLAAWKTSAQAGPAPRHAAWARRRRWRGWKSRLVFLFPYLVVIVGLIVTAVIVKGLPA